jgi:hypothetical protein
VRGADHSYRGVITSSVCPMSVIVKPRKWEAVTRNRLEAPQKKWLNEAHIKICVDNKNVFLLMAVYPK